MSQQIVRDGSIGGPVPIIPSVRLPAADLFQARAGRLLTRAEGHSIADYLRFTAALARAQDAFSRQRPAPPLPAPALIQSCIDHGLPSISFSGHRRHPYWREALASILEIMARDSLPAAARQAVAVLARTEAERLESTATALLAGNYPELDAAQAPFIGAALQVYWTGMVSQIDPALLARPAEDGLCPTCGSRPMASIIRIGGAEQGLRYLVCSLCAVEWHMVRVKCAACAGTKGITYLGIEGSTDAIRAECCDSCKSYLKIFNLEKDTSLEVCADDLASLALDMLVSDEGYDRAGPNLLFLPGAPAE
jgi:FdhE protein